MKKIEKELGRSATDNEIAAELGINENELGEWLKAVQIISILSLDQSFGEDESFFFLKIIYGMKIVLIPYRWF